MIMNYGSFAYFLYPFSILAFLAILAIILKKCPVRVQKGVVLAIAFINLFQHLFKFAIYPMYKGTSFNYINTAYNMCATLIITSPFALICKNKSWKDFICCAGVIAGLLPMFVPTWFIGKPAYGWEMFRFYFCHSLLLYSSMLPLILKHHHLNWKNWYKYPLYFTLYLIIILVNDVIAIYLGLVGGATSATLHSTLYSLNPLWIMHPSGEFSWVETLLDPITPDAFFSNGNYVPILWYLYPMCIMIAIVGIIVGAICDRKNFIADFKRYKDNIKNFFTRKKHGNS